MVPITTTSCKDELKASLKSCGSSFSSFRTPFLGSVLLFQRLYRKLGPKADASAESSNYQIIGQYYTPLWYDARAWQVCCYRSQLGWTINLTTSKVVPGSSPQFIYARLGHLAELQSMIAEGRASILDQRSDGSTLLSVSLPAVNFLSPIINVVCCRWQRYLAIRRLANGFWSKVRLQAT